MIINESSGELKVSLAVSFEVQLLDLQDKGKKLGTLLSAESVKINLQLCFSSFDKFFVFVAKKLFGRKVLTSNLLV